MKRNGWIIDAGKATVTDEAISARIYDQEGNLIPFTVANTTDNRGFIQWLQRHDRYGTITQEEGN